ncbi:potassium transporter Trk [Chitinispirillum alkaliphilum]|nr:potassium transporter Trk [Chitinispirillum alkaliphilum]
MYLIAAIILLSIVLIARIASKWRVPLVVIALATGVIFGSGVTGLIYFDDAVMARQIADFALIFVLFIGGFGTRYERLKTVFASSMTLATVGVALTALLTGVSLVVFLNYGLVMAFLIGCIISSTDAAAVFSILRSRSLNKRLSSLVEIESATNDPMAIVLTTLAVRLIVARMEHPLGMGLTLFWNLIIGIAIGLLVGKLGVFLFHQVKVLDRGYFYIFLVGLIMFSFGLADVAGASGMISAFFAGFFMGNSDIPYKKTISTLLEAISTIANVIIFVILGLLVFPRDLLVVYREGIALFLIITFFSRPLSVLICTTFTKFNYKDRLFISWSGLRGAVPIVLATYPLAAGIPNSRVIFNMVFFAVVLSLLVQGSTITKMADLLKLTVKTKPKPSQVMELATLHKSDLELVEIQIDEDVYSGLVRVDSLRLPKGTVITMINRKDEIIAPHGSTVIKPSDVLYVLVRSTYIDHVTAKIMDNFELK